MKTLLQPIDIVDFTPVQTPFNVCTFRELYPIEYREARECLGVDLWSAMVDALADYSAAAEYIAGTTYPAETVVKFQGVFKVAKVETSNLPSFAADWESAPRFTGACAVSYEGFFCYFLGPYLSFVVLSERVPYLLGRLGDKGVNYGGRSYSESAGSTGAEAVNALKKAIYRDRQLAWNNLAHYLAQDTQKESGCFEGFQGYDVATLCGCGDNDCPGTCRQSETNWGGYEFG